MTNLHRSLLAIAAISALPCMAITPEAALDTLYSRMSLPDSLDFSREFFRKNVDAAFRARAEMPWGSSYDDRTFLDFVVPVRTNNELLDESRTVFYAELAPRVRNLGMAEAALEVNHWAHEKATYRPSDARTSSPLATVRTSWGRCGEESAFVVAAMRAVGIPARQVYTPRWAHTDDNHAWVEVMVDGRWHFLGGCEPEPMLDLGWFNAPAARGMLMNTRADGRYTGPEEVLTETPYFSLVNVTPNYAPTAKAVVSVIDTAGCPVDSARVCYGLYNYAEYYPIAERYTDKYGLASVTTGLGDLVVWAVKGDRFGLDEMNVAERDGRPCQIDMSRRFGDEFTVEYDLTPPAPSGSLPVASQAAVAENERRKACEDSVRTAYMATFMTVEQAREFAERMSLDTALMARLLPEAYGNHAAITGFLEITAPENPRRAQALVSAVSEKDLRDVDRFVLLDSYYNTPNALEGTPLYDRYALNPRIANENLTPYKFFFLKVMSDRERREWTADVRLWADWVRDSIEVSGRRNPRNLYISPQAVYQHRLDIDPRSRDLLFVAGCRSLGVPARIDPVSGAVQYSQDGNTWTDVSLDRMAKTDTPRPMGRLVLTFTPGGPVDDPKYYANFSVSRIDRTGVPVQLEFEEFAPWSTHFAEGVDLDAGYYVLTSGQRLADGTVLARSTFFNVKADSTTVVPLVMRHDESRVQVLGAFNSENRYFDTATSTERSMLSTTGRGNYVIGLITANTEPVAHALNDLRAEAKALDEQGVKILLVFADDDAAARFKASEAAYAGLPKNVVWGVDRSGAIACNMASFLKKDSLTGAELPVFLIADTFNRVLFSAQGYTIGLGASLLSTLRRL